MEPYFYIAVNIKTPGGMLGIARYDLGKDPEFAQLTFDELEGGDQLSGAGIRLDLLSASGSALPVCIGSRLCNLDQYAENCRTLTRSVFKHFMFEDGGISA